jgi:hypothetical protein
VDDYTSEAEGIGIVHYHEGHGAGGVPGEENGEEAALGMAIAH